MSDTIQTLADTVRGRVIGPSDPGYDEARQVYNGMHDRRPRAVVQCADRQLQCSLEIFLALGVVAAPQRHHAANAIEPDP